MKLRLPLVCLPSLPRIGLWIGHFKIKGVGLGIGGVLFGGILVAHFTTQYGIKLDSHTLHFVQEFGLILFVYTIGIQVGSGLFASLRKSGLTLNGLGILIVALGAVVTILIYKLADIPSDVALVFTPVRSPIPHLSVRVSKFF